MPCEGPILYYVSGPMWITSGVRDRVAQTATGTNFARNLFNRNDLRFFFGDILRLRIAGHKVRQRVQNVF